MRIEIETHKKKQAKSKQKGINKNIYLPSITRKKITDRQKKDFYKEFATLIRSGVDFNKAINILIHQQKSKLLKTIYKQISNDVVKGKSLNEAMQRYKYFSPYEYYSVKIGEETKRLPEIFDQLEQYYDRKIRMKRQVTSVLAYPVFVLVITFAVLYFMLNYVVPMFTSVFQQFGKDLPAITKFIVNASKHFNKVVLITLGVALSIYIVDKLLKEHNGYLNFKSSLVLKLPFFGGLIRKIYTARFCQTLALLLSAKTPLITSLDLTEKMMPFYPLKRAIKKAKIDILKGDTLGNSLKKDSFFSTKLVSLTTIGEQINELDKMYNDLAKQYNDDIEHSTKLIGTILEPAMIVIIGTIVGFIMIAMYSPIFNLSKVLEN